MLLNQRPRIATLVAAASLSLVSAVGGQSVEVSGLEARLQPAIERMMIEGRVPSATIALVAGDRVVWSGGFGVSNLWARTLAVPSTVYLIGSTFKAMSTVALLQQMEQGRFALDHPVSQYLTDLRIRGEDPGTPITFRHLLTHTSGLPVAFDPYLVWSDSVPPPLDEYLARDLEVISPPMDSVRYSNLAYSLVAHLVARFSGQPYREYMQREIFDPLAMVNTAFDPTPHMGERLAVPYMFDAATGAQVPAPRLKASVWPAGIVYGTVLDQANWLIANLNGGVFRGRRIISEHTLEQMHTRQWDEFAGPMEEIGFGNATTGYGLTWWTTVHNGERYFAHSGSVPGYTAFLLGNRDRRLGFAILTNGNRAHPHLVRLAHAAIDALIAHTDSSSQRMSGSSERR
jgi:CubicO group peptidase (beta-lactamase class C family)